MSATTAAPVEAPAAAPSSPVRDGLAALVPLAIAYTPFALVVGTALAAHDGGITGWAGSWLVYGGSAQLAALRLVDTSGAVVAILTGLLVNARMAVYTASLGRRWRTQPRWFRLLAASLVIDATWALGNDRPVGTRRDARRFFLTVGLGLGAVWCTVIGIGAVFGGRLDLAAMDPIDAFVHPREQLLHLGEAVVVRDEVSVHGRHLLVHLVEARVHLVEARVHLVEARVDRVEARVRLVGARIHRVEPRVHLGESRIDLASKESQLRADLAQNPHDLLARVHAASESMPRPFARARPGLEARFLDRSCATPLARPARWVAADASLRGPGLPHFSRRDTIPRGA